MPCYCSFWILTRPGLFVVAGWSRLSAERDVASPSIASRRRPLPVLDGVESLQRDGYDDLAALWIINNFSENDALSPFDGYDLGSYTFREVVH